jgi:hypothetical protein
VAYLPSASPPHASVAALSDIASAALDAKETFDAIVQVMHVPGVEKADKKGAKEKARTVPYVAFCEPDYEAAPRH